MAEDTTKKADLNKVVAGLSEQVTILRGELEAAKMGNPAILDRQQFVRDVLDRFAERRQSKGKNRWLLFDRRKESKPPVEFYSKATTPQQALSDYRERTGLRFVGSGSDPFYCKPWEPEKKDK